MIEVFHKILLKILNLTYKGKNNYLKNNHILHLELSQTIYDKPRTIMHKYTVNYMFIL